MILRLDSAKEISLRLVNGSEIWQILLESSMMAAFILAENIIVVIRDLARMMSLAAGCISDQAKRSCSSPKMAPSSVNCFMGEGGGKVGDRVKEKIVFHF